MQLEYIKYQSSLPLINRVKDVLYSYDAAGLIDEGQFYSWIKEEMQLLGLGYYKEAETILQVNRFKAPVPHDFVNLYSLMRCTVSNQGTNTYKVKSPINVAYIETCETNILKAPCTGFEYFGKIIRQEEHIEFQVPVYRDYEVKGLLKWTNRVGKEHLCAEDCVNLNTEAKDEFSLDENFFYFNFDQDSVHLKYYKLAVDEDGLPLIPDVASVKKAIETLLIFKLFQQWWYNGEGDVERRKVSAELEYEKWHSIAIKEVKMPSFNDMIDYGMRKREKTNKFQLPNYATVKLK